MGSPKAPANGAWRARNKNRLPTDSAPLPVECRGTPLSSRSLQILQLCKEKFSSLQTQSTPPVSAFWYLFGHAGARWRQGGSTGSPWRATTGLRTRHGPPGSRSGPVNARCRGQLEGGDCRCPYHRSPRSGTMELTDLPPRPLPRR